MVIRNVSYDLEKVVLALDISRKDLDEWRRGWAGIFLHIRESAGPHTSPGNVDIAVTSIAQVGKLRLGG